MHKNKNKLIKSEHLNTYPSLSLNDNCKPAVFRGRVFLCRITKFHWKNLFSLDFFYFLFKILLSRLNPPLRIRVMSELVLLDVHTLDNEGFFV